jgi:hypothetical protein
MPPGMKSFLLFMTSVFIVIISHAQSEPQIPVQPFDSSTTIKRFPLSKFSPKDSVVREWRKKYFAIETPPPGSMRKGLRLLGNNQNGFEVYQTMQDNMYILKPDSSFVSNMPVLKMPLEEKPETEGKKN